MSDLEGGVRLPHSDGRDPFEPFGSSFCPNWRESGAQLTEKQAVLLMHDIYIPQQAVQIFGWGGNDTLLKSQTVLVLMDY